MHNRAASYTRFFLLSLAAGTVAGCTNDVAKDDLLPNAPASAADDRDDARDPTDDAKNAPPLVDTSTPIAPAMKKGHDMSMD